MAVVRRVALVVVGCGLLAGVARAEEPALKPPPSKPRVALVLSGGGARGAAHIGVLRVLEELRVPVDLVVGTSMGSIIGGLYSTGWSPDDMETLLLAVDWARVFSDRVERTERTFRRKLDDYPYLIQTKLRFRGFRPYLPSSVLAGQRLELLLRSIEIYSTGETDFNRLPIPYRAVACDLATGGAVVLDHGSIATAMRASMSIPAAFPPVDLDGRKLIDGGSAANFPVGIAQQLGAEHVIGVDISSQLDDKGLESVFGVYGQLSSILIASNRDEDTKRLGPGDVLIVPELGDLSFVDFKRAKEAVAIGEAAARARAAELQRYSVSEAEYAAYQAGHRRRTAEAPVVDEVQLVNSSPVADEIVERRLNVVPGAPLDYEQLEDDLINLYNLDYFGVITDRMERAGGNRLVVETPKPRHGRASMMFGLSFANDFQGDSQHAFTFRHRLLAANRRGGEWTNVLQTGDTMLLSSELYQPLDSRMTWFAAPYVEGRRVLLPLWLDGEEVAEYWMERQLARVDAGRTLGNWGELRVGVLASTNSGETRVGATTWPDVESDLAGAELGFRVDTLDAVIFPTRGLRVDARYTYGLDALGSDEDYERASLAVDGALSWKKLTFVPGLELASNLYDDPSIFNAYPLGGFARLSGLGRDELLGKHTALARLLVYQQLAGLKIVSAKVRVVGGISLETGNAYLEDDGITWDSLRFAGSVFVGADTSAGLIRLAYGFNDGGSSRAMFCFGQSF